MQEDGKEHFEIPTLLGILKLYENNHISTEGQ